VTVVGDELDRRARDFGSATHRRGRSGIPCHHSPRTEDGPTHEPGDNHADRNGPRLG
jgi:hypothetical protein